ncbi:MAG: MFS transporter [Cyclobacteriaceae bacterium]|nr:MFS transporter [Cyclobacteriaceae bacterium]MCB0498711.1 MFS transporter [Cyclobacteriaceae bacterium]MCB9237777.1 MFS transporter [Flammeovirgaceae bacterium]MCO5270122.1 MFS transporter [Cyclobacteriaceae bacterium]MCW5903138.1 MFS transporter [Cyclobacteriaceae bacterium]
MATDAPAADKVLPIIVFAQFACTSLWFAGNAVLPELQQAFHLPPGSLGNLTSSVQLGFILGTLLFALLTISDRYSPSKVFFACAVAGALANFSIAFVASPSLLFLLRSLVGFFLAGIYPVGMKISADYHEKGLGKALGYLVGALVVGTASPHLIRMLGATLDWHFVIYATSALALLGGAIVYFLVPDGPFRRQGGKLDLRLCFNVFKEKDFRGAAFGYFGHMWELYTLWAFVPFILTKYNALTGAQLNVPLWSFLTIASGGVACVLGGHWAEKRGSKATAFLALALSCLCCVFSVFFFQAPAFLFLAFMVTWGMAVVADSPQFSTLVAKHAPHEARGTALTIVNSIGFAITIFSLQSMTVLMEHLPPPLAFTSLALGPLLGLMALGRPSSTG